MNEMIERVAKDIGDYREPESPTLRELLVVLYERSTGRLPSARLTDKLFAGIARTAIEAMREPTEAMKLRGQCAVTGVVRAPSDALVQWQAMIDAALEGEAP